MQKATRLVYFLLKNTFLISLVGLLIALTIGTENYLGIIFGTIGFYGALLTISLFLFIFYL